MFSHKFFRFFILLSLITSISFQPFLPIANAMVENSTLNQTGAPDLTPTSFQSPSNVSSQDKILVSWSVINQGTAEASASWRDNFYLSTNDTWDSGDTYITYQSRSTALGIEESYSATKELTIPKVSAGEYFLILRVDGNFAKVELDETNNDFAIPISISNPDLSPVQFNVPTTGASQSQITIDWLAVNIGTGTAQPSWSDNIYLSANETYETGDTLISSFTWSQAVLPTGTYSQSKSITLPKVSAGNYYLLLYLDAGLSLYESIESNNVISTPITITNPDLTPSLLNGPGIATSQEPIQVSWTVQNNGGGVATPSWRDGFYLSVDDIFDNNDVYIKYFNISSTVQPGDSYLKNSQTITMPSIIGGDYYLLLRVDYQNSLYESDESNNAISLPITITNPDLIISNASAPATVSSQEPIQVSWTVKNIGIGTAQPSWTDAIYLSTDATYSTNDVQINYASRTSSLLPEASYTKDLSITIPKAVAGEYFLVFRSDTNSNLFETENANNDFAIPITISNPNLQHSAFSSPSSVSSQDIIQIEWIVDNTGSGSAFPSWRDGVYLSSDEIYDSSDILINNFIWSQVVPNSSSYTQSRSITIPKVVAQNSFLLIRADYANALFESNENDNVISAAIEIKNPDLSPIELIAPETASTQNSIKVSWVGKNQGLGDANPTWNDTFYLSLDGTLDASDTVLSSFTINQKVIADSTYNQTQTVPIPKLPGGTYYLILKLNSNNGLFEPNNTNNVISTPIRLDLADLKLASATSPLVASINQQVEIGWTVNNIGSGTATPSWYDRIYLSSDNVWDTTDVLLGSLTMNQPVDASATYSRTLKFPIPSGTVPGSYFFIVKVDSTNSLYESNEGNNDLATRVEIKEIEYVDLPWMTLSSGLSSALGAVAYSPDGKRLTAVSSMTAIQWDVQTGAIVRKFNGHTNQIDTVDYSPNGDQLLTGARDGSSRIWDPATGLQKRSFASKPGEINPAVFSEDGTLVFAGSGMNTPRLWNALTGEELRLFTGHTAAVNDVDLLLKNEVAVSGSADKTAIVWNINTGEQLFTLNAHTSTVRTVKFSPVDEVVLTGSDDGTLRLWNYLTGEQVGSFIQGTPVVSAQFSVDGQYIISCDNKSPGSVYLWEIATGSLVKIFRAISGDTSVINRVAFSPDQAFIASSRSSGKVSIWHSNLEIVTSDPIIELTIGEDVPFDVSPLSFINFSVATEYNKNLVITLNSTLPQKGNNIQIANNLNLDTESSVIMLVKFGDIPNLQDYDQMIQLSLDELNGDLPIAPTYEGAYYISVFSPYLSHGVIPLQISADYVDMHVSSIEPKKGGNNGNLTLKVTGTRFTPETTIQLIDPTGNRINGSIIAKLNETTLFATFQMNNSPLGLYDLRVEDDGVVSILFDPLEIVPTINSKVDVEVLSPSSIRPGKEGLITIDYQNTGNVDAIIPLFKITSENAQLRFPQFTNYIGAELLLYGVNGSNPISVLPPGGKGEIQLVFKPDNTASAVNFRVARVEIGNSSNQFLPTAVGSTNHDESTMTHPQVEEPAYKLPYAEGTQSLYSSGPHGESGTGQCSDTNINMANAIDLAWKYEVLSIAEGRYVASGRDEAGGAGYWITIEHADGIRSSYWHLENGPSDELQKIINSPDPKALLPQGFPIANTGATGCPGCGVHLHLEIGSAPANPSDTNPYHLVPIPWDGFNIDNYSVWASRLTTDESKGISYVGTMTKGETSTKLVDYVYCEGKNTANIISADTVLLANQGKNLAKPQSTNKRTIVDPPAFLTVTSTGPKSVKLTWADSKYESRYQAYQDTVAIPFTIMKDTTELPVINLTCGVSYTFSIRAISLAGESDETIAEPFIVPCTPQVESEIPLAETSTTVVRPIDPNDKLHTEGDGDEHFVPLEDRINYTVRFENMATANAPVQELVVVDYIDPNLDWSTIQFSEIAYGSKILTLPRGVTQFYVRDFPTPGNYSGITEGKFAIDITVKFNPQTGRVEWRMVAIDTATEEPPTDPLSGFLPPEDGTGRGMGFLSYSIRPKPGLPGGTVISNFADIVFDTNDPIRTNTVFNTIRYLESGSSYIFLPIIIR